MSRRFPIETIDAVLAHPGSGRVAAMALNLNENTVSAWRSGILPDYYRSVKGLPARPPKPAPTIRVKVTKACLPARASVGTTGAVGYTVAQIDRALACETHKAAAASLGIPESRVAAWRRGELPAYYRAAKAEAADAAKLIALAASRAARFVRPQDARAGR